MTSKIIFLHLPKNGGSTFNSILHRIYDPKRTFSITLIDPYTHNLEEFKNLPDEQKDQLNLLTGHMFFGLHQYLDTDFKYITFLRNPVERVISFYYYVQNNPTHWLYEKMTKDKLSLYDLVTSVPEAKELNNGQVRLISGIDDTDNLMLEKALENIENHFSFVGFAERYDESLVLMQRKFNWPVPYYKIANITNKPATVNLDQKTRDAIIEYNKADIELYENMEKVFNKEFNSYFPIYYDLLKLKLYNKFYSSDTTKKIKSYKKRAVNKIKKLMI